jgi:hypothetical protein
LDEKIIVDLGSLKAYLSGEERNIGFQVLELLYQLWFKNITFSKLHIPQDIDFFSNKNKRMFVCTYGQNTLLEMLSHILKSAFIFADRSKQDVQLTVLSPFHNEVAIQEVFKLKNRILKNLNLENKEDIFNFRLLTNSFNVTRDIDRSSFSNPSYLKEKMFPIEGKPNFRVKFWGYNVENEDFIHAKIFIVNVGNKKVLLITSANLTLSGLGLYHHKNLEVGVIENLDEYSDSLYRWVEECWESEYLPTSKNDKIWNELDDWYNRLIEEEEPESDFIIEGMSDFYTYKKNTIKVKDIKKYKIKSLRLLLSFPVKEKPVKNIDKKFSKRGKWFKVNFLLSEKHLGPVFCDIVAEIEDGSFLFLIQKRVRVVEKFPKIDFNVIQEMDVQKEFLKNSIPVQVEIEKGRGITKIDLNKIGFKLSTRQKELNAEILLIREREETERIIQFLLYSENFWNEKVNLEIIYENNPRGAIVLSPDEIKNNVYNSENPLIEFQKNCKIDLISDKKILCPKIDSDIKCDYNSKLIDRLKFNQLKIFRYFTYSDLIGIDYITRKDSIQSELKNRFKLKNDVPFESPINVEAWFYGIITGEWITYIPFGKINYRLLRNPPEIQINQKKSVITNVTPVNIEFEYDESKGFREEAIFNVQLAKKNQNIILKSSNKFVRKELPLKLSSNDIRKGIELEYRFKFKYNLADVIGRVNIPYDYFITSPHQTDPTKTKMLIYDLSNPCKLLSKLKEEIPKLVRPKIKLSPIKTHDFSQNRYQSDFKNLKEGVFEVSNFRERTIDELNSKYFSRLDFIIKKNKSKEKTIIPFELIFLLAVKTDSVKMIEGGFGKTITVYHPDQYKKEFENNIKKLVKKAYENHLKKELNEIKDGNFLYGAEKAKQAIKNIKDFIKYVKTESFAPIFKPKRCITATDARTLKWRKVIELIVLIRKGSHTLNITINGSSANFSVPDEKWLRIPIWTKNKRIRSW